MKLGNRKSKAFTLVEFLMVLAVIALLTSIMMPSIQKVKELAQSSVCRSNLHQTASATALYAAEYENQLPINNCLATNSGCRWYLALNPYLDRSYRDWRGPSVFICPSNVTVPDSKYVLWFDYGYICNLQVMPRRADDNGDGAIEYSNDSWPMRGPVRIGTTSSPNVVLISDANFPGPNGGKCLWIYLRNTQWATDPGLFNVNKDQIHPDGVNVLFADLSVRSKSAEELSTPGCDVTDSGTWGYWGQ